MAKRNELDATTTRSDRGRGADIVQQSAQEEKQIKQENSKGTYFRALNDFMFNFNEVEEREKQEKIFTPEQLELETIQSFISLQVENARKAAFEKNNSIDVATFRAKFDVFPKKDEFTPICGYAFETAISSIVTEKGVKVYHSISEEEVKDGSKKSSYLTETVSKETIQGDVIEKSIWVELVELSTSNLLKGLRYFTVFETANNSVKHLTRKANKPFNDLETAMYQCAKSVGIKGLESYLQSKLNEIVEFVK